MEKRIRAVRLPLHNSEVEQTEDLAVFVASPERLSKQRRQLAREAARRAGTPRHLAALGLPRAASAPCLGELGPAQAAWGEAPELQEDLRRGVMQRAAEQTMVLNLKHLAEKQRLRYGRAASASAVHGARPASPPASPSTRLARRLQACAAATRFTARYSETVGILEEHMILTPPQRRHSLGCPFALPGAASPQAGGATPKAASTLLRCVQVDATVAEDCSSVGCTPYSSKERAAPAFCESPMAGAPRSGRRGCWARRVTSATVACLRKALRR